MSPPPSAPPPPLPPPPTPPPPSPSLPDVITGETTTVAGSSTQGSVDGVGTSAQFSYPSGVSIAPNGNFALVTDRSNHLIRHVNLNTGATTRFAGSTAGFRDGVGTDAQFNLPCDIAIDLSGTFAVVADLGNNRVRVITLAAGTTSTISNDVISPHGIAISPNGDFALVGEYGGQRVRRVNLATGATTTLAGSRSAGFRDGVGASVLFSYPWGVAIDPTSTFALVGDLGNHRIRHIDLATGRTYTFAGSARGSRDGVGTNAQFASVHCVAIDPSGTFAMVSDYANNNIRRIDLATREVSTVAGNGARGFRDGVGTNAQFNYPWGIDIARSGGFALVADTYNHRIRRVE